MLHRAMIFVSEKEHFSFVMLTKREAAAGGDSGQANAT